MRFINRKSTAVEDGAVHCAHGLLCRCFIRERHESKTARTTRIAICHHLGVVYLPEPFKSRAEPRVIGIPAEAAYKESITHSFFHFWVNGEPTLPSPPLFCPNLLVSACFFRTFRGRTPGGLSTVHSLGQPSQPFPSTPNRLISRPSLQGRNTCLFPALLAPGSPYSVVDETGGHGGTDFLCSA